jgi:hypothetical protein
METSNSPVFTLTIAQMYDLMIEVVKEALKGVQPKPEETEKYLTRLDACKALHISLPTLTRYSKLGLIHAKRIGNRILYSEEDVKEALTEIPSNKFRK